MGKALLKERHYSALLRGKRYSGESVAQGKTLLKERRYSGESVTRGKADFSSVFY